MVLRFSERYLTWLNLLLIAVVAYFLALSVNGIVRGRLSGGALQLSATSGVKLVAARHYPRAYYEVIARRDIFNLEPEHEAPAAVATNLHVKLLGTSHLTLSRPFIILQNETTDTQSLYRLGDEIQGVGKLIGVYKDSAVLLRNGHRIKLEMPSQPGLTATNDMDAVGLQRRFWGMRRLGPRPPGAGGVLRMGPDRYAVNRSTLNNNLKNMASLFTQIRAIPNIGADGRSDGFKLSEIQPGSLFQRVGLQDGDVLTSVEGQTVSDPMRAMQLLNSLSDRSSINLTVTRNGQPVQLHYDIR
jgi:general secretion pathway protein C